jgi:hypothetical protein
VKDILIETKNKHNAAEALTFNKMERNGNHDIPMNTYPTTVKKTGITGISTRTNP